MVGYLSRRGFECTNRCTSNGINDIKNVKLLSETASSCYVFQASWQKGYRVKEKKKGKSRKKENCKWSVNVPSHHQYQLK